MIWKWLIISILPFLPLFIYSVAYLEIFWEQLFSFQEPDFGQTEYDYIIVGGGSAGCVLARRLSDDGNSKVALIEAGGTPSILTSIPALASFLQLSPFDWSYQTVQQDNACLAMKDGRCLWPRGKMLGGSSNLNYMIYVRGDKKDYDDWANITKDDRWRFEQVLDYFKKAEGQEGRYKNDVESHGTDGLFQVKDASYTTDFADIYHDMATKSGYRVGDINNKDGNLMNSFTITPQVNLDQNSHRADTYRSYLKDVVHRDNLHIIKYAIVTNVIIKTLNPEIHNSKPSVHGVEFFRFGSKQKIFCKKEVIISAGSIGSPKILLQSGVGPKSHLEDVGIKLVKNLKHVGENLIEHLCTTVGPFFPVDESGNRVETFNSFDIVKDLTISNVYKYFAHGIGPLSATGAIDSMCFFNTNNLPQCTSNTAKSETVNFDPEPLTLQQPNLQVHFFGLTMGADYGTSLYQTMGIPKDLWDKFASPSYGHPGMMFLPVLLHPKSNVGSIRLASSDPLVPPLIDPNYFSNPVDIETLVKGIKHVLHMLKNASMELSSIPIHLEIMHRLLPNCIPTDLAKQPTTEEIRNVIENDDEYWKCYVKHLTLTMYHPVGTCRMGTNENDSVTDSKLKVHGIDGLRVVDASIMPATVSGNTNAPTVMIAEVASDLIIKEWSEKMSDKKGTKPENDELNDDIDSQKYSHNNEL